MSQFSDDVLEDFLLKKMKVKNACMNNGVFHLSFSEYD